MYRLLKISLLLNMFRMVLFVVMITFIINVSHGSPLDYYVFHGELICTAKVLETYPSSTHTVYVMNMTSQKWLNGRVIKKKTKIFIKIILLSFSFFFFTTNLVALCNYYSTFGIKTSRCWLSSYQWWK